MGNRKIYLMVTTYFPTPEEPWRCSFTYDQVRAIQRASDKYEVVVLRPDREGEYEFRGVRVIGFRYRTAGGWLCPWLMNRGNVSKMFQTLRNAGIALEDLAVTHGHLVSMATYVHALKRRNRNVKALLQFHDADPYGMLFGTGRFGWLKRVSYFLYHRALVEKMDMLIAISRNVAKVIAEAPHQSVFYTYAPMRKAMRDLRWFRSARAKPAYVLHNGVNQEVFRPVQSGDQTNRQSSSFTIGCIAVFRDWKDQITLLRAVNLVRPKILGLKVKLIGVHHSGTMLGECKRFIEENNLPVEIISSLDHNDLPSFYSSLDLFVLPSYFEGFGCVFTESWSCGVPFVTCEGQGMDDYIYPEDRHLWLCKQRDPEDLAQKILYYYKHRPQQRLAAETDIDVLIPKFLDEVEKL